MNICDEIVNYKTKHSLIYYVCVRLLANLKQQVLTKYSEKKIHFV